jgi:cell division protein FtsQ
MDPGNHVAFGRGRNRRRIDAAQRAAAVRGAASRWGPPLTRVLVTVIALVGLVFGGREAYAWASSSPQFGLRAITFHGLRRANEGELCRLAGLSPGQNLFQLDLGALAHSMASHPWVRSVDLRRQFPSSVVVVVTEQEPVALVSLGDLYMLNRDGEPFKRVQAGDAIDLPLVTGVDRELYVSSPRVAVERLRRALSALSAYEASDRAVGPQLSEIRLEADGFTLVSATGVEVHLGEAAELARLSRVMSELQRRRLTAEVIRLDNRVRPGWVTVKIASMASVASLPTRPAHGRPPSVTSFGR